MNLEMNPTKKLLSFTSHVPKSSIVVAGSWPENSYRYMNFPFRILM